MIIFMDIITKHFRLSRIASILILMNVFSAPSAIAVEKISDESDVTSSELAVAEEPKKKTAEIEINTSGEEDEEVEFNNIFLSNQPIDVKRFSKGNPVTAGKYTATVMLNEKELGKFDIKFDENPQDPLRAIPCLTQKDLVMMGIDLSAIDITGMTEESCVSVKTLIPQASWKMDINEQIFNLHVPQAIVLARHPDEVPETLWNEGVAAGFASYSANYYRSSYDGEVSDSAWMGVDGGFNFLGWRLRIRGDANYSPDSGTAFDSSNLYLAHDVSALKSQLRIGEIYSGTSFFDSIPLHGATLSSDMQMLPDSLNSFRPVIRGVAESNAKITVSQAGNKILETTVSPGPFSISEYSPISTSEELDVSIQEADGRIRQFSIPFNGGGQLVYPGVSLYSLAVGEYNGSDNQDKPVVGQATWQYGLNNYLSLYTGAEYMSDFYSAIGGVAFNLPVGALSVDITHSNVSGDDTLKGQSIGVQYNGFITPTDTSFNIAAYRYSTENFYTLSEAIDYLAQTDWQDREDRIKSQVQVNISQSLSDGWGSFYTSATLSEYWTSSRKEKSYQLGYSNTFNRIGYSISVNRYYTDDNEIDDQLYLSLSIPLGDRSADNKPLFDYLNTSYSTGNDNSSNLSSSASGYNTDAGLNYGVNASYRKNGYDNNKIENIGANATWDTRYGSWGANISADTEDSRQFSVSGNGGMLIHKGGITLGRTINGESPVALIEAKGAEGAIAMGDRSTRINSSGYTYVSNLSAYRFNEVGIDPSKMERDTELKETSTKIVPRAGAIIYVPFETDDRRSVFFRLKRENGKNIPLGAEIISNSQVVGIVGQSSRAFTRGVEQSGSLSVIWGEGPDEQCRFDYDLPVLMAEDVKQQTLSVDNVICN